ncbi:MAG: hypothetical protein JWL72_3460 [Ilumatobacteraceae bacterium]|nr:hypothetical protein [Ilumatobacteraceae bacterium]
MFASSSRRVPRAHIDPVRCVDDALAIFNMQIARPMRAATLAMFLDGAWCGSTVVTITDTPYPFQVVEVAEAMAMAGAGNADIASLVLATIRPGGGPFHDDDELWREAVEVVEQCGLTLIDWFVIGRHGAYSPRELISAPSRWPDQS